MPKGPLKPFGLILVVAGLLGGVVFAFFAAAVADLRSGRVIERWQIERELGVTILTKLDDP
jgi:capsular polysaccharide biosynthesis protein